MEILPPHYFIFIFSILSNTIVHCNQTLNMAFIVFTSELISDVYQKTAIPAMRSVDSYR